MTVRVQTEYMSRFSIAHKCVACGGAPGSKTKGVSGSASSGRKQYATLTLDFPLCEGCAAVRGSRWYAVLFAVAGVLVYLVLGVVAGSLVGQRPTTRLAVLAAIVVIAVAIYLTVWLANRSAQSGMAAKQRKRRKALRRSVRISVSMPGVLGKGSIRFAYENPAFSTEFAALDGGTIGQVASRGLRMLFRLRCTIRDDGQLATVVLPALVPAKPWHALLHNQTAWLIKAALL